MFVTGSVHLESFHLTAYFCKTVYSLSVFMCYCEIICAVQNYFGLTNAL